MLTTDFTDFTDLEVGAVSAEFLTCFMKSQRGPKSRRCPESNLQVALLRWPRWPKSMLKHELRAALFEKFTNSLPK